MLIEWRKEATEHTGSAELNGITGEPTIYAHPRDNSDANLHPRASPAVKWIYNHDDAGETPVVAVTFEITVQGNVSYEIYRQKHVAWQALPAANRPTTFEGQEGADEVFVLPLATDLQPSGSATYVAWMRMNPHSAQDQQVSLTADIALSARANGSPVARFDGGKAVSAAASLFKGSLPTDCFRTIKTLADTKIGQAQNADSHSETFTVTVPAGKFVRIGDVKVGPGFRILAGSSTFECKSKISFTTHRNIQGDSVHQGCTHIDTGAGSPATPGGGSGN